LILNYSIPYLILLHFQVRIYFFLVYQYEPENLGMTLRDDDTGVYIDVWDKGKGIDESHIDKVFELNYSIPYLILLHFQVRIYFFLVYQYEPENLSSSLNHTLEVMELIHKFFDLAKLESGDKAIEMTKVNMNEVSLNHKKIKSSRGKLHSYLLLSFQLLCHQILILPRIYRNVK
jgi:hypothetical protein